MAIDEKSSYYDAGGIECIKIIKAKLTEEQFKGFCLGNTIKYLCRCNFKHESIKRDIEKANNYLQMLHNKNNNLFFSQDEVDQLLTGVVFGGVNE